MTVHVLIKYRDFLKEKNNKRKVMFFKGRNKSRRVLVEGKR